MATRDGRRVRDPEYTRTVIVDAALELFTEGHYSPTAVEIANRAEVAPRTLFVHFPDLETLAVAAARRQAARWQAHGARIPSDAPRERRVDALLAQRSKMYELMTPLRRGGLVREAESARLHTVLVAGDAWLRENTAAAFAPELACRPDARARGGLLDALETATSWAAWDHLRSRRALGKAATTQAIRRTVLALLAD